MTTRTRDRRAAALGALVAALAAPVAAQQTDADSYTRYELLSPGSAKFRVLYDVSATTPGATQYFNGIRRGSVASDVRVTDRATGRPLAFEEVDGRAARARGLAGADTGGRYLRVTLARPVAADGGEGRILIDKTYLDAATYLAGGDTLVFTRSLSIKRNTIVLPVGFELVSCNYPSQILQEADGRIAVSFWNATPAAAPLVLRARRAALAGGGTSSTPAARRAERATQTREIVYFLEPPETHAFALYHDYTETRAGVGEYLNIVRAGSTVSKPSGVHLDTGDTLAWEILKGEAIARAGLRVDGVTPSTEVVRFRFAPPPAGGSARVRLFETYTDSARYRVVGDELVWDRAFGRPANAVVLPAGWALTNSTVPGTVSTLPDGRVRLDFINPRTDDIQVLITARRRR